ncbi:GNAT family N-acetyltransferase [Exiguobacterium flavidum]|uniref:GNAT family N-acetyltransferase n=1 Tax=Exiguobacterium flavidum TaxID=2184695 RepID=UPI000DF773D9|nr:GNAT family N-acetyltransferase [Exiguobacterium flavidum]
MGRGIEIRRLTADDAQICWQLRLEALKDSPSSFLTSYEEAVARENPIEGVTNNLSAEENATYGAWKEGVLVGVATFVAETRQKTDFKGQIVGVYVTPGARGKGLAKRLLQALLGHVEKESKVEKLTLGVMTENLPAIRLYESLGFTIYAKEERAMRLSGQYIDEYLMEKWIERTT